jgi:surface antigen
MDSMLSHGDPDAGPTGSINRPGERGAHGTAQPAEADLAYARAAVADVLGHPGRDGTVPWQNPQTGAGGNILPLASSRGEGGGQCRDFLASYVSGGSQTWLEGSACRGSRGEWEVKNLRPLEPS